MKGRQQEEDPDENQLGYERPEKAARIACADELLGGGRAWRRRASFHVTLAGCDACRRERPALSVSPILSEYASASNKIGVLPVGRRDFVRVLSEMYGSALKNY